MSGGIDYVWGPQRLLARRCNQEAVEITPRASHDAQTADNQPQTWHNMARGHERETDETSVRRLVETHFRLTGSFRAREILDDRSEEHTSELQSLMRISYAVFCLKKKNT